MVSPSNISDEKHLIAIISIRHKGHLLMLSRFMESLRDALIAVLYRRDGIRIMIQVKSN